MGYIYKIVNSVNNKIYVGKTTRTLDKRLEEHRCEAQRYAEDPLNFGYKTKIYPAMSKYGIDNFDIFLIEEVNDDLLNEREMYWIAELHCLDDSFGYNISPGGLGGPLFKGHHHSEETRRKLSLMRKGRVSNRKGIEMSKDQKDKISFSLKRYYLTSESRITASNAAKKVWKIRNERGTTNTTNGMHIYNDGQSEIRAYTKPDGFVEGRLPVNNQKTSDAVRNYYTTVSPEILQERRARAAETVNNWTQEKRDSIRNKISIASKNYRASMSQEEREDWSKKVSDSLKQYHRSLTEEEKQKRSLKNSLGQKGKKRYYNVYTGKHKMFYPDSVPEGWEIITKS